MSRIAPFEYLSVSEKIRFFVYQNQSDILFFSRLREKGGRGQQHFYGVLKTLRLLHKQEKVLGHRLKMCG